MSYKKRPKKLKVIFRVKTEKKSGLNAELYIRRCIFFTGIKDLISQHVESFKHSVDLNIENYFCIVTYEDIDELDSSFHFYCTDSKGNENLISVRTPEDFYFNNDNIIKHFRSKHENKKLKIFNKIGA